MPIQARCPCGKIYQLADELAGKQARCKVCKNVFQIAALPSQSTDVAQASQTPQPMQQPEFHQQQQPLQQPFHQQGFAQPPNAQQPTFPVQGYPQSPHIQSHQSGTQTGSNKHKLIWIGGAVGAVLLVLIVAAVLIRSGGNDNDVANGDGTVSTDRNNVDTQATDGDTGNRRSSSGDERNSTVSVGNSGSSSTSNFGSLEFAKSNNGLCELITYRKLRSSDSTTSLSRNGKHYAIATVEGSKPQTTIELFHKDNPGNSESHVFDGKYTINAVNNDGRFLAIRGGDRNQIFDWQEKETIRIASVLQFSVDGKHAILNEGGKPPFLAAFDLATRQVAWATKYYSPSKVIADDFSYELTIGSRGEVNRVNTVTREAEQIIDAPEDRNSIVEYYFSPDGSYVLARHKNKLTGFDALVNGKKFLEMELGGRNSNVAGQASADRSIAAVTLNSENVSGEVAIGIVDLARQIVIDRIPVSPLTFKFNLSDDGSTIQCIMGGQTNYFCVWNVDHKISGSRSLTFQPFFLDLPADQRISSEVAAAVNQFDSNSQKLDPAQELESYWSNSIATVIKAQPSTLARLADDVMFSPNGYLVAVSDSGENPVLWDYRFLPKKMETSGKLLGISPDGNRIAIKSPGTNNDEQIEIMDRVEDEVIDRFSGSGFGEAVFFAPDGESFLVGKGDQVLLVRIGSELPSNSPFSGPASVNSVSPDFKQFASIKNDVVEFFDIASGNSVRKTPIPPYRYEKRDAISFESNRMLVKAGSLIYLVDLSDGETVDAFEAPDKSRMDQSSIAPDGQRAVLSYSRSGEDHYMLVDLTEDEITSIGELQKPDGSDCIDFAFSRDGSELFSYSEGPRLKKSSHYMLRWKINR